MKQQYTVGTLKEKNLIIFSAIIGSRAYGTHLPTSDTDIRGVFIQPIEDILGFGYVEQVSDKTNDITYYEIRRFLQLVSTNNPNILELLNVPKELILHKDPIFDLVTEHMKTFVTKQCKNTFAGYAIQQIKKARGYDKKINWEESKMIRKNVLDFCYIIDSGKSVPLLKWLDNYGTIANYDYKDFALAKVDHAHDMYAMYLTYRDDPGGIVSDPLTANDVQVFSIPKNSRLVNYLTFNKDAYSIHCKQFKEYETWVKERNPDRFKMNKSHGKNYDSKNLMHTYRLLNMSLEIAKTGQINVRRGDEEIKTLMSIRRGEMEYDELVEGAEKMIKELDEAFDNSTLPDSVDQEFVNQLLINIRQKRYKL